MKDALTENCLASVWIAQSTMDYNFRFREIESLIEILGLFKKNGLFSEYQKIFEEIRVQGLTKDFEAKKSRGPEIQKALGLLNELIEQKKITLEALVFPGGSPYISAEFGNHLRELNFSFPRVYFCGNLPAPVQAYNSGKKNLEEMCRFALPIKKCPGTLSLELHPHKIMLASSEGRKLEDFDRARFIDNLKKLVEAHGEENIILAIGGLNSDPAESYSTLIQSVKMKFPEIKVFIGTNSFASKTQDEIRDYWTVLKLGDIISFNDEELRMVYDAVYAPRQISLARKLKELEHQGIKLCHAAEGAILDPGHQLEKFVRDSYLLENPRYFLEAVLTLAADGATFVYERQKSLGYPSPLAIQLYSSNVQVRWQDGFRTKFVFPDSDLANGLLGIASAKAEYPLGRQTGTGAFFDVGFVSFFQYLIFSLIYRQVKLQK